MARTPSILLVDNGSLQPAATLTLRGLAARLGERLGQKVEPISLLHSSAIAPDQLEGIAAEILLPAIERRVADGVTNFVIVPLFFGPSQALSVYVPENMARLKLKHPALRVHLGPALHDPGDLRLATILADHVREALAGRPDGGVRVALVDHGSPVAVVTKVRNELAQQLGLQLAGQVSAVSPCSMERRPDPAYDFCNPLLESLLGSPAWADGEVIVAMQFLLPGRHAGPDGDVATICRAVEGKHPRLRTQLTKLVAEHPGLIEILADRATSALQSAANAN